MVVCSRLQIQCSRTVVAALLVLVCLSGIAGGCGRRNPGGPPPASANTAPSGNASATPNNAPGGSGAPQKPESAATEELPGTIK